MATFCTRMIWLGSVVAGTVSVVNGRVYTQSAGVFDAFNQDVVGLVAAGAIVVAQSGALPYSALGIQGLPGAGLPFSGISGPVQASGIAVIPDVSSPDPARPAPVTAPTTLVATAIALLSFAVVPPDIVPGMLAKDNTTPGNLTTQTVASAVWGSAQTLPLTATTTTSAVLTFGTGAAALAALANVLPGMSVKDNTTPANLTTQTVLSVNMATGAVTLSATAASVPSGDSITFFPTVTLSAVATIPAADSITFTPAPGTRYMDAALNRLTVWDGQYWRDAWSGQPV